MGRLCCSPPVMVAGGCESNSPDRWEGRAWRTFCGPGTKLIELYVFRGTMLISG